MWSSKLSRRACLSGLAALTLTLATSCGFHLRGQIDYEFRSIYVDGAGAPSLAKEINALLRSIKDLSIAKSPKDADVTLTLTDMRSSKDILSLTSAGRAREYVLSLSVSFALTDINRIEWMPSGRIGAERTFLYDDSERLAREIQESEIHEEIENDLAHQILRRLQKARKPA
jgi:LPS-assembly lipoprotein